MSKRKLIAYQLDEADSAPIRVARRDRKWMDESAQRFAYRCLPLVMANQFGWEILSTHHIKARWDGTSRPEGLEVENLYGDGNLHGHSQFGCGILSFLVPFLFRTPSGWNLMVRGPTNNPKDGIVALDGIIETDWAHSTFTMNWRFTRACSVEFLAGEPICLLFPIQRGVLGTFEGEIRMLSEEPEVQKKFETWSASRGDFLGRLLDHEPEAVKEGWQKHYTLASLERKTVVNEFRKPSAIAAGSKTSSCSATDSKASIGAGHTSDSSGANGEDLGEHLNGVPPGPSRELTAQTNSHVDEIDYIRSAVAFREQRYLPVKSILPSTVLALLKVYYQILISNDRFTKDDQCPGSLSLGGDPGLDAVLEWIRPEISRLAGIDLVPTYSYTRIYAEGDSLARHTDRPSCEISLTASVSIPEGRGPSTIFLKPPGGAEVKIEMLEGDGCLYFGSEVEHWREPFESGGYMQLFLHFIARHGKNFPEHAYDQRPYLGSQAQQKPQTAQSEHIRRENYHDSLA